MDDLLKNFHVGSTWLIETITQSLFNFDQELRLIVVKILLGVLIADHLITWLLGATRVVTLEHQLEVVFFSHCQVDQNPERFELDEVELFFRGLQVQDPDQDAHNWRLSQSFC